MKEVHTTAVVGTDGVLTIELEIGLAPGTHQLTILVDEQPSENGVANAAEVRRQLTPFLEDWDNPEMSAYDAL